VHRLPSAYGGMEPPLPPHGTDLAYIFTQPTPAPPRPAVSAAPAPAAKDDAYAAFMSEIQQLVGTDPPA
jgi:hypothetical protein